MTFNSVAYALFLPIVVLGHWALPRRARLPWLLAASYVFYGAWDWRFLGLLWLSTAVDYTIGRLLDRDPAVERTAGDEAAEERRRRRLLVVSVVVNLGILATFKYFDFFVDSATGMLEQVGLEGGEPALRLVLPVGISFYTFQSLSYTIDVYRGHLRACRSPVLFATFVAFFPQLVAGPIERAQHLLPQLATERRPPDAVAVQTGLELIFLGLVKKVVIGDSLAPLVDQAFRHPGDVGGLGVAAGVVAFALQIYADFSGYTDVARGSSRLLGVELMHNFREPYLSRSVTEFWRRWHISLSRWLRDYLYIPLGGNRGGEVRTSVNLMVTMLLGGLWHGASWHFVAWGGLHGLYLVAHRRRRHLAPVTDALPRRPRELLAVAGTFVLVCIAWVLFRSPSLEAARQVFDGLLTGGFTAHLDDIALVPLLALLVLGLDVVRRLRETRGWCPELSPVLAGAGIGAALGLLLVFGGGEPVPFVYFQF